jgi:hypothetical protein
MELSTILWITLIIYTIVMSLAFLFKVQWLYMIVGLLWFIPLIELTEYSIWFSIIAVTMIIVHFMLGLTSENEEF